MTDPQDKPATGNYTKWAQLLKCLNWLRTRCHDSSQITFHIGTLSKPCCITATKSEILKSIKTVWHSIGNKPEHDFTKYDMQTMNQIWQRYEFANMDPKLTASMSSTPKFPID